MTAAAITKALDSEDFIDATTLDLMDEAKVSQSATGVTLPTAWLATLLAFVVENLPAILALILAMFG